MLSFIESNETFFRLFSFFSIFIIMALAEWRFPKRLLRVNKLARWLNNIALIMLNTLILRVLFPLAGAGFAAWCVQHQIGLFNVVEAPVSMAILVSIIVLDGVIWLQHRLFHQIPLLWRLHAVHHADLDLDTSSGARFHPIEMLLSMLIKFAAIALLGAPIVAVIIFEMILSTMALFNHSNFSLPAFIDKPLRWLLVTPDMHRIHHSIYRHEQNSNYGFNLSVWDRVFNTYRHQPEDGHHEMVLGLRTLRDKKQVIWISGLLRLPFTRNRKVPPSAKT